MWTQDSFHCQLCSAELPALWCRKELSLRFGSTFLCHLLFKSHLHQLQPFICTIQPELSKPLQISDGQGEKSSQFPGRATRMLPWGKRGLGSKSTAAQTGALSSGLYHPLGQPENLLINRKRKRTESVLQKVLCLSASGQVTDVRPALQSYAYIYLFLIHCFVFTHWDSMYYMLYMIIVIYINKIAQTTKLKNASFLQLLHRIKAPHLSEQHLWTTAPWCWEQGVTGNSRE